MNFKRYHVSKNLFNVSSERIINGRVAYDCPLTIGQTYTFTNCSGYVLGFKISNWPSAAYSVQILSMQPNESYTFTMARNPVLPEGATQYFFIIINDVYGARVNDGDVMLNSGSQPLPYEPYSSEVWHDIPHYIHNTSTDTITTLPAVLYPNDTTATVGLKGNTVQNGTPTPDNPIMPQGTGERTGNLYNINAHDVNNGYVNNAQLNQDGTVQTWGSSEISEYIPINGDTAYTFNGIGSYNSPCYALYDENKQLIGAYKYSGRSTINFISPNNARYFRFTRIKIFTQAMTVEGTYISSTMPEFEPYGYKIPISSASTTTPVYLGEVETTRRINKLVLDGTENWQIYTYVSNTYRLSISNAQSIGNPAICSHFVNSPIETIISGKFTVGSTWIYIRYEDVADLAGFKAYLATQYANGTPVIIWYVLETETTGVVNEPIRKIGNYTDTVSGISIPTIAGANSFDVLTTLKPSEVTVNYKGWHPVTDVHERDNGVWT